MGSTGFMGSYALYAGSVTLVGAGPGDPELLTLQAFKLLKSAELVVADRLVSREILDLIDCELRVANKKPGCAEEAQEEINQWVVKAALEGKRVIRLKIGDPFLFGRGGEEVIEYRKSGIEAQVVPGISSAYSAPLAAMVPITHRGVANEVVICTGFGREGTTVDAPEYRPDRTVVLLMAVGRIGKIAEEMVGRWGYPAGKCIEFIVHRVHSTYTHTHTHTLQYKHSNPHLTLSPCSDTPVSIIEQATTPRQRVLRGTLEDIGEVALQQGAKAPATIVVGNVNNVL